MPRLREDRLNALNKAVNREKAMIEKEIEGMNSRLSARGVQGEEHKIIQEIKRDLFRLEKRMEELLQMCRQQTRAEDSRLSQESKRAHAQLDEKWYDWLRYVRRKNLASAANVGKNRRMWESGGDDRENTLSQV